jgi:hypothetical protein
MKPNILLLTATVTPPPEAPNLVQTNPRKRLNEYKNALSYYLTLLGKGIDGIVLTENSNSDVSTLHDLVAQSGYQDRVELLSFYGLDYPPGHGRGYGEYRLVDYTMSRSHWIQTHPESVIWKVTGRYIVRNLVAILCRQPRMLDVYCNFRIGRGKSIVKFLKWMDMYLLAWTHKGYQEAIRGIYTKLQEDTFSAPSEILMREAIEEVRHRITLVPRLNMVPWIEASRGWDGQNMSRGMGMLKYLVRPATQRAIPWLWI